jgi:ArsR family transcriptional regulator, nickel/cobalt-responsive transcriptional repressor
MYEGLLICIQLSSMPHPAEHHAPHRPLGADEAEELTETLKALASPGRLRLLTELLSGPRTVEQLAATAELSVSATSHHLRLLRSLRLVRARRDGRHVRYALHDHHIGELLAAVRHHHEHVHPPAAAELVEREEEPAA